MFTRNGMKKAILYYLAVFVILVVIQAVFNTNTNGNPYDVLLQNYNIQETLDESAALNTVHNEDVVNVISIKNNYVFKTSEGNYYMTEKTDAIDAALELEGVEAVKSSVGIQLNIWTILFYGLLFVCIIRLIISVYKANKFFDMTEKYVGVGMDGEFYEGSPKRENEKETTKQKKITFDDVQGIEELKPDLYRLVDCLKKPAKYEKLGARSPKGVILYGPPGTGKTLTAKAIAGEAGVPFFSMCGSDFMEKYVGVGASRIRELYAKARKAAPCIVFIDEIDSIGGGRGEQNNGEKDQTINALLAELDGFKSSANVLTICATNRLDILDPALMRPGRFDLKLAVGLPDRDGRLAILKLHGSNKKFDETVKLEDIAKKTIGFSGAALENLLNESALLAAERDKQFISQVEIEDAFFKVIMDGNKKKRKKKDADMILTAYHEAGHTLATKLLTDDGVTTVTIIPSTSGAGGVTFTAPDENNMPSKKYLRNQIMVDYAGRAAEEVYLGNSDDITTGASQDIKQATSIIKSYIGAYGMGNKGLIDISQLTTQYDIVEEATKLSNQLYSETLEFLKKNKDKLKALADALIEKESLYEDEIDDILGIPHKVDDFEAVVEEKKEVKIEKNDNNVEIQDIPLTPPDGNAGAV